MIPALCTPPKLLSIYSFISRHSISLRNLLQILCLFPKMAFPYTKAEMPSRYGMFQTLFFPPCSCLSSLLPSCFNPSLTTLSVSHSHAGDLKIWAGVNLCSIVLHCSLAMVDWLTYLPREREGERFYALPVNSLPSFLSSATYGFNLSAGVFLHRS